MRRRAVVKETFLIASEEKQGQGEWFLRLVGETETKEEAFQRAEGAAIYDGTEAFVIPCYKGDIDYMHDPLPEEFKDVEPKGELPNPATTAMSDTAAQIVAEDQADGSKE